MLDVEFGKDACCKRVKVRVKNLSRIIQVFLNMLKSEKRLKARIKQKRVLRRIDSKNIGKILFAGVFILFSCFLWANR